MLRRGLMLVGLLLGCTGVPALAAYPTAHEVIARYSFDGTGDATMIVSGSIKMSAGAIFVLTQVDETSHGNPVVFFPEVLDLDPGDGARTFGAPGNHTICPAPLTCSVRGGMFGFGISASVEGDGRDPLHLRMYLAARGAQVTLHDKAMLGWRAHHRSNGLVTRSDADAGGAGADVEGYDVGVTTGTGAAGPVGGSVALAIPGCDQVGAGLMTLTGGRQSVDALCPSGPVGAFAWGKTTWQLAGAAAGVSQNTTRLVVIPA